MPATSVKDTTLDLLLGVNRLLGEADKVRELRDRLMTETRRDLSEASKSEGPAATPKTAEVVS